MHRVFLRPDQFDDPPAPFRTGEAGRVWVESDGAVRSDTEVRLSANSTHALLGHGVVDALNGLPIEGALGDGLDVLVPHAVLEDAQRLFYEADRKTYGGTWSFEVAPAIGEMPAYWVEVVNREYQRTLSRLTFLLGSASRAGHAVRLRV